MIVVSMVLAGIALVLLVVGLLFTSGLALVYASIATTLLGGVALAVGCLQLRRSARGTEDASQGPAAVGDGGTAGPAPDAGSRAEPGAVPVAGGSAASASGAAATGLAEAPEDGVRAVRGAEAADAEPVETDDLTAEAVRAGGTVLVVRGRRRYHVHGCGHLTARGTVDRDSAEERDVAAALAEGYTPCGVCAPDRALVTLGATYGQESPAAAGEADPGTGAGAGRTGGAGRSDPTPPDVAVEPGSTSAPRRAGPAEPIVVAAHGAFHRVECPEARAEDAEPMTKSTARRRELTTCGVCRP